MPLITASLKSDDDAGIHDRPELIHERYGREVALVVDGGYGSIVPTTVVDLTQEDPKSCGRVRRNSTDGHNDTINSI